MSKSINTPVYGWTTRVCDLASANVDEDMVSAINMRLQREWEGSKEAIGYYKSLSNFNGLGGDYE